jgi:hypothetical protein
MNCLIINGDYIERMFFCQSPIFSILNSIPFEDHQSRKFSSFFCIIMLFLDKVLSFLYVFFVDKSFSFFLPKTSTIFSINSGSLVEAWSRRPQVAKHDCLIATNHRCIFAHNPPPTSGRHQNGYLSTPKLFFPLSVTITVN